MSSKTKPPRSVSPPPASPVPFSPERVRASDAFAVAYARKRGGRVRVRPDVWLELRAAGADMALYICDTR
ncbi:hypothetical protein KHC23_02225 [Ancylobacter dichloromethanicus]|uniref:Uncharacterized protein n=1 Tax=Ancylobacter dichloromethanicus TaxID=518825 RepID=A0A9W6JDX0_9HYPH|nr:hypothetical protein [Ancylobacter dichloromethanicus]MBS7552477.1 hypothetical protein [Ancylobacter dichloromethanicus]GLK74219.1 hypothetical protein GCM10017643_43370 [Ancylobacter dichloromethanicus]